jgi:exonuclease III
MATLKVATWNVRGLGGDAMAPKLRTIKRYVRNKRIHILLLQETKMDNEAIKGKEKWWKGKQYWSPAQGSKGGTAILINANCPGEVTDNFEDALGHWQWITLKMEDKTIGICNVYAPCERYRKNIFMEHLPWRIPNTTEYILGGDWNAICEPGLDSPRGGPPSTATRHLRRLLSQLELTDIYRERWPNRPGYT